MVVHVTAEQASIIRSALILYAAELEKTAKSEAKVGVPADVTMDRIRAVLGSSEDTGLLAHFEEQGNLLDAA